MQINQTCNVFYLLQIQASKSANVFGYRTIEQFDPLRQIAKVRPQLYIWKSSSIFFP